jgi:two-component system NtrC family sensor kinase
MLVALGQDLPRIMAGATLVSGFYLYLSRRSGAAALPLAADLLRIPFLYVAALYYGHLVNEARTEQERSRRIEREKTDLQTLLEVTSATTSTLDLHEVLLLIVQRIAALVNALRCSIVTVNERDGSCEVLASSDDPKAAGIVLDLDKYPEIRKAVETREAVVINDVAREPILEVIKERLARLGFRSIMVVPIVFGENLLGMLVLRAAREERRFSSEEITACQVVANASANAIRNAMLYDRAASSARSKKETADKLQNILDHFPDLVYTTDMEGRLTEFSRGGESLLGWPRNEVLGRNCAELYPDREARERLEGLLRQGRVVPSFETVVRCRDGSVREALVAASRLRDAAGTPCGTVGIIKNIADLQLARRQLVQAEKLSALGELVSGVAHELNNPLAGVLGYSQLLLAGKLEARQQKAVDRIFESALRCQKIVQNLQAFARRHPIEKKYLGLNGIVEKTLDIKGYHLRVDNLRVVKRLDPDLPMTMLDFNQMQQVLLNIINNAQQAMVGHRGQGTLTITSKAHDGLILLEVEDDGPGVPQEILGKIFDPFFTTKQVGQGTGLGLAVSYGIVRDHGGRIWAESEEGRGTRICVELPIMGEGGRPAGAEGHRGAGRPLNILVVDDESVILDLIVDAFGRANHKVDTASSGREALEKLERRSYDVLLLDLKMPEMDGRQLYDAIKDRWPDLSRRIVFASGDTLCPETQTLLARSGCPCVDKPFRLEALENAINSVADDAGRQTMTALG